MEKRYYWLKLKEDFFSDFRIKKLRKIAGGDTYTIIYLKMQLLALNSEGIIIHEGLEPTLEEEVALKLDEKTENVSVTVSYLKGCGLLYEVEEHAFELPHVLECIGSEAESTARVRRHREQKLKALHCNNDVTQMKHLCNTEIEIETDKEIDKEKDAEKIRLQVPEGTEGMMKQMNSESILFHLKGGGYFELSADEIIGFINDYPSVNVPEELLAARRWLESNPSRRKTRAGMIRFINGWLCRNRGVGMGNIYSQGKEQADRYGEIDDWIRECRA